MNERVAVCEPLSVALAPKNALYHCNYCFLYSAKYSALVKCQQCNFVRYCNDRCKELDSGDHRLECSHLQGKLEPWYNAKRIWDKDGDVRSGPEVALLMFRLYLKTESAGESELTGKFTEKTWANLMTHAEEIKKDEDQMRSFRKCAQFVDQIFLDKLTDKPADIQDQLFQIFCKIAINSHSIFVWTSNGTLKVIGISLGIDSSAYDHSCRPNAQILWQGRRIVVIPMDPKLDAHDISKTFISYKYLVETKKTRRLNLKRDYHFTCECPRCKELIDNQLSAVSCVKCRAAVNLNESQAASDIEYCGSLVCPNCELKQPRKQVLDAVQLMLDIQVFFNQAREEMPLAMLQRAEEFLPRCNVYYGKLARKLAEDYDCDAESKAEFWLNHYNVMRLCSPECYVESLEVTLKCCFFLLRAGEFFKAAGLFAEIESIVAHYFLLGPCPFERLLQYLYSCIVAAKIPKMDTFWAKE